MMDDTYLQYILNNHHTSKRNAKLKKIKIENATYLQLKILYIKQVYKK